MAPREWEAPRSISVKPDGVLLMMSNLSGLWLPDAALADGTPDDVRQLIGANGGRTDPAESVVQENPYGNGPQIRVDAAKEWVRELGVRLEAESIDGTIE